MYAETDFYLALLKEGDWLKDRAIEIYGQYKNSIWTSQITTQELLLYVRKYAIKPTDFLDSFYGVANIIDIQLNRDFFLVTAHIMEKYNATPFDAMHAEIAKEDGTIISSDAIYDRMKLNRIRLEERD